MKLNSIRAENFRPFRQLEELRFGTLTTIVGQNDAGKSSILHALNIFLGRTALDEDDIHDTADPNQDVIIELSFSLFPEHIELEPNIQTTLLDENLLDENGLLRIQRRFPRTNLANPYYVVVVQDYQDEMFAKLAILNEDELNQRCQALNITVTPSGRSITNKDKRAAIRNEVQQQNIIRITHFLRLDSKDRVYKCIIPKLPDFNLFESEVQTDVEGTWFQKEFRPLIEPAVDQNEVREARDQLETIIQAYLQEELDKVYGYFEQHTDSFEGLVARPVVSWNKAVKMQVLGKDKDGIAKSLEKRGSGVRRLLMVSFFRYLVEKKQDNKPWIFAIEEPENCLHPGLQRELVESFQKLTEKGYQIIVTTHSPVFAGMSPLEDLTLITRESGIASSKQTPELDLEEVASELGIEPSDLLTCYHACVFVEGKDDAMFWESIAKTFKDDGHIAENFEDTNIGFIIMGGKENLKHWVTRKAMKRLNRRYAVICDSDLRNPNQSIDQRLLDWKSEVESDGGLFFYSRKREIENYLHPDAIQRSGRTLVNYDSYDDVKQLFGEDIIEVIQDMSSDEILQMDSYNDGSGATHHELKEIIESLLSLS